MKTLSYAIRAFRRAGLRNAAYVVGLALAVALVSSTLFFVDGAAAGMTQRAVAPVVLDFQARSTDPRVDVGELAARLSGQPGVRAVRPFVSAGVGVVPPTPGGVPIPARLLALPPDYLSTFPLLPVTTGRFDPGGALVSEQLAAALRLAPGAVLELAVPGLPTPYRVTVTGTVNTDAAEPLFSGPVASPEGSYNGATAVVAVDLDRFARDLRQPLLAADQAASQTSAPGAAAAAPHVDRQLHIRIDRSALPADPGAAQTAVDALRRSLERQASGQIKITDNVSSALTNAAKDVVSARLLFVFLGLPGVLLAAELARQAAALVAEAQRRDIALLRARGAAPREILTVMGWSAILTALVGAVAGLALGAAVTALLFGPQALRDVPGLWRSGGAALLLGLAVGAIGVYLPARAMLAGEVAEERRSVAVATRPLWLRLPVDAALLAGAALALWFASTYNTKAATAGAGETAAVSLGVYAFLGPLLFWLGAAVLVRRVAGWLLARPSRGWRGALGGLAARSLRRRAGRSAAAALLLVLAVSFGVASTVFGATFDASRRADARYLIGSDLRVTPALVEPQPATFAERLRVPGVRAVTPVYSSTDALVGSQTQTVYGVDLATLPSATTLEDRFFVDDTAAAVIDRLRQTPDGLLVSNELAASYNVQTGDTVAMRIPRRSGGYADVTARVVGIFSIFPTSSQNSDLVVNSAFLTAATGNVAPAFFLVRTDGTAATNSAVADAIRGLTAQLAVRVDTADKAVSQDQSSLVGVDLAGLAGLDRLDAALVVGLGLAVFLLGGIAERRRELGTLQALGATIGQVTRMLMLEALVLAVGGAVGGVLVGGLLAWQYTGFLPGIFSVPLPVLSVPVRELVLLLVLAVGGAATAVVLASASLRRLWPAEVLRDA